MKKIVCILLSGMMLLSCFSFNAGAETGPPTEQVPGIWEQWDKDLTIRFADGDKFPYTGKPITPKFIVSDSTGRILVEGTDYRVEYWNNTDPGTAVAYLFPEKTGTGYTAMTFYITGTKPNEFEFPDIGDFGNQSWSAGVSSGSSWGSGTRWGSSSLGWGSSTSRGTNISLPKAVLTGVAANGKGKIKVKWKKCSGINGYQVQYSTNKKFKKNVKVKTAGKKKTSLAISGFKKKKTYYVRIRTYKKSNDSKKYGKWSKVKKIKITK